MKRFEITTDIAAPPDRVWRVMSDVERWHEWTPSISGVTLLDGASFAVGSQALVRQPKLPPARWTITSIQPGRRFTWTSVAPGFRAIGDHEVVPTTGGSRTTLSLEYHGLFGALLARVLGGITTRYIAMEAEGLTARSIDPEYRALATS